MSASISTHVLDAARGLPASGIAVALHKGDAEIARGTTDGDGRIRELARDLTPGTYRIVFETGSPFFKRVAFDVEVGEGAHHIPLLLSPYSLTSYRGS